MRKAMKLEIQPCAQKDALYNIENVFFFPYLYISSLIALIISHIEDKD